MDLKVRSKSAQRMNYEAQVEVIKGQIGGLDEIRTRMGLSQRKMAQLLLVDPSAWTRWTSNEGQIPPHIWRSLQWYLGLQEKIPGLTPQYFLGGDSKQLQARIENRVLNHVENQLSQHQLTQETKMHLTKQSVVQMQNDLQKKLLSEIDLLKGTNSKLKVWIGASFAVWIITILVFVASNFVF